MSASICPGRRLGLWPVAPACLLATLAIAASPEHAAQSELEGCRRQVLASPSTATGGAASHSQNEVLTRQEIDAVTDCMRSKNYLRIDDTVGICDHVAIVQCFEKSQ
jgi:hypothetical protein